MIFVILHQDCPDAYTNGQQPSDGKAGLKNNKIREIKNDKTEREREGERERARERERERGNWFSYSTPIMNKNEY